MEDKWIATFCDLRGNEQFCRVDEAFVADAFNTFGLEKLIAPHYRDAMDMILSDSQIYDSPESIIAEVEKSAQILYGLIHARYILTTRGATKMLKKHQKGHFGTCPRVFCNNQLCVPVGLDDTLGVATVKTYCPKCNDVFVPKALRHQHIDGAYFGTTFPHIMFALHPQHRPTESTSKYTAKIYGFKLHATALDEQRKRQEEERQKNRALDRKKYLV